VVKNEGEQCYTVSTVTLRTSSFLMVSLALTFFERSAVFDIIKMLAFSPFFLLVLATISTLPSWLL